eukprot:CAMPEP_0196574984 /NCGR_PEP_ID=MMETSP1081-20130531/4566_1 /TAXON_ID=36882 /ORGANISM="Pyramimonas amylifera, Strain CCMP720" /LENGTH=1088 /DNA_ID=CAMNT_0041893153 /DNA_START=96 /DNA_END=3362 /DNA_ORIENTATION=+
MNPAEKEELQTILAHLLIPANETRKKAEERLKVISKNPSIILGLLEQLHLSADPAVRQLAAVLLRKRVTVHWMKLPEEHKEGVKQILLDKIVQEPTSIVRRAAADVVAVVAKHTVPAGQWPTLLGFLMECARSQTPEHREVALVLFCCLLESLPSELMRQHFPALHQLFLGVLTDAMPKVRAQALKGVQALLDLAETPEEMKLVGSLLSPSLVVCSQCVAEGEEDVVMKAFEMLFDVIEGPNKVLQPVVKDIVQFCLQVGANTALDSSTRQQGMEVVSQLAVSKPKLLQKSKLAAPVVAALCHMCAEPTQEDDDDDYQLATHKFASQALDTVAQHIPATQVVPAVMEFCTQALPSADPNLRRAALTALAVCAEGCCEIMRKQLGTLLPPVTGMLTDPDQEVRGMSAFAVSQFAVYLQPDILEHHQTVLSGLFTVLRDPDPTVQERAMYALEAFCSDLEEGVVLPYMTGLMQVLMDAVKCNAKVSVQEMALSAATSIASSAGAAFQPYLPELVPVLQQCISQTHPDHLQIRASATECLGILIASDGMKGVESLGSHIPAFMQVAIEGFSLDSTEVKEYTHRFFANVSEAIKTDIAQYLQHIVPLALASLAQDDGLIFDGEDDENDKPLSSVVTGVRAAVGDSSEEDEDGDGDGQNLHIRTGILDEKSAACVALGASLGAAKAGAAPYLEACLPVLLKAATYFHEDVRSPALTSLHHVLLSALAAAPLDSAGKAPPNLQQVIHAVLPVLIQTVEADDDADVVCSALLGAAEITKALGAGALAQYLPSLAKMCDDILKGEATCQQEFQEDEDEEDEEEDHEGAGTSGNTHQAREVLLEGVAELLPALCTVGGAQFVGSFMAMFPHLMKYGEAHSTAHQRATVSAALVDTLKVLKAAVAPIVPQALPFFLREMSADDTTNRRNAAFAAGVCCEIGGEAAGALYPQLLQALAHILNNKDEEPAVKDNAAGALARMLSARAGPVPAAEVLQILISALPLKEDMEEAEPVYSTLCQFLAVRPPDASLAHLYPSILQALGKALVWQGLSGEEGERALATIKVTLQALAREFPEQLQNMLAMLPPDEQQAVHTLVSS